MHKRLIVSTCALFAASVVTAGAFATAEIVGARTNHSAVQVRVNVGLHELDHWQAGVPFERVLESLRIDGSQPRKET